MPNAVVRKFYGRVKRHSTRHMTIQQALTIIGLPHNRVYVDHRIGRRSYPCHYRTFWEKDEYELQDIVNDVRRIFHERLKEVHHDFTENHEEATTLIGAYQQAVKLFRSHGVPV